MIDSLLDELVAVLGHHRYVTASEADLQNGLAVVLTSAEVEFEREVGLDAAGRDRVDFLLAGGIALEVKIHGALSEVTRQVHRYAGSERVKAVLLVTTRMQHRRMPDVMQDKPVRVLHLEGSVF